MQPVSCHLLQAGVHVRAPEDRVVFVLRTLSEYDRWCPDVGQEGGVVRWEVPMRLGRRYRAAADARVLGQTCLVELVMGSSPMVRHVFTVTGAGRCDSYVNCATSVPSRWRSFVDTRALMQSRPRVISGLAQRAEWLESAPDTSYVAPRRSYGSAVAGRRYQ